jgi:hypothetical protein
VGAGSASAYLPFDKSAWATLRSREPSTRWVFGFLGGRQTAIGRDPRQLGLTNLDKGRGCCVVRQGEHALRLTTLLRAVSGSCPLTSATPSKSPRSTP